MVRRSTSEPPIHAIAGGATPAGLLRQLLVLLAVGVALFALGAAGQWADEAWSPMSSPAWRRACCSARW